MKTVGLVVGRVAIILWSRCGELAIASPRKGTGVLWVWSGVIPPPKQGGGSIRAPVLTYVVMLGGVVVHMVVPDRGGFCGVVLSGFRSFF